MRIPILLMTFTIAGTLVAVPPQLSAQTRGQDAAAKALFLEGRDSWDDGNFVDAERKFREALTKYPRADQSDRTAWYLINTLIRVKREDEARAEIQAFYRNYPKSTWLSDVDDTRSRLGGMRGGPFGPVYRAALPAPVPVPPPPNPLRIYAPGYAVSVTVTPNPVLVDQELFRVLVQKDANVAIGLAKERLKANPSDPAVVSNFSVIAGSGSPHAFPFFVSVASHGPIPNTQTQAQFWIGRLNNAEDAVGKAFIQLTSGETLPVFVEVLNRSNFNERGRVLRQVVEHPSPEKVIALERVFKATTVQPFRAQIVESTATIPESAAREFLTDVAKHEREIVVRLGAIQALGMRKDVDASWVEDIMKTMPSPAPPTPIRVKKDVQAPRN